VPLYRRGIAHAMIGPAKLERNLRRFFKAYAEDLRNLADNRLERLGDFAEHRLEHLASQLVGKQAKLVARSIIYKYSTEQEPSHQEEGSSRQEQEQSSDEENEACFVDETEFHNLVSFRKFLVDPVAFGRLHTQIRSFIMPKTAQGAEFEAATKIVEDTRSDVDVNRDEKILGSRLRSFSKIIRLGKDFVAAALVTFGYLERPLRPGYNRLRWQCVSKFRLL
jgi:hypothetical protein